MPEARAGGAASTPPGRGRRLLLAWAPAAAYMLLIWTLSSFALPNAPIDKFPMHDKGVHFCEYGFLAFLVAHAAFRTWPPDVSGKRAAALRVIVFAILVTVSWGLLDEIHQAFVPGRTSDVMDLVADMIGATGGATFRWALGKILRRS